MLVVRGVLLGQVDDFRCESVRLDRPIDDDNSDDNPDDSCTLNDGHDCPITGLSCLVTTPALSWQCGGQGFESP